MQHPIPNAVFLLSCLLISPAAGHDCWGGHHFGNGGYCGRYDSRSTRQSQGSVSSSYAAPALGCPGFVSMTANFVPELSLALLEAADACDFLRVRELMVKIAPLYEFAGICARHRGRDPWVLPDYTAGHIYVGVLKAAMEIVGLAAGPVRGPGDDLTSEERAELKALLLDIGLV
jgi:4-hydroxy-tetrahydrodipicolinate synthase